MPDVLFPIANKAISETLSTLENLWILYLVQKNPATLEFSSQIQNIKSIAPALQGCPGPSVSLATVILHSWVPGGKCG
jgi:hypothetical protein